MAVDVKLLRAGDEAVLDHLDPEVFDDAIDPSAAKRFLADPNHRLVVALEGHVVVGFVSGTVYFHPDKVRPEFWINEVSVAPSHRPGDVHLSALESGRVTRGGGVPAPSASHAGAGAAALVSPSAALTGAGDEPWVSCRSNGAIHDGGSGHANCGGPHPRSSGDADGMRVQPGTPVRGRLCSACHRFLVRGRRGRLPGVCGRYARRVGFGAPGLRPVFAGGCDAQAGGHVLRSGGGVRRGRRRAPRGRHRAVASDGRPRFRPGVAPERARLDLLACGA